MRYSNGSVVIKLASVPPAVNVGHITNFDGPQNSEVTGGESGAIYDETLAITNQAPVPTATSKSVDAILSAISLAGSCITDGDGVDFFARRISTCKNPAGASDNLRWRFPKGLLVLGQLTAERGQDARVSFSVHALTDGTNAPVAPLSGVALPTGLVETRFVLGKTTIAGLVMPDLQSVTLDFGIRITDKLPEIGGVWPDTVGVLKVQPVLTLPNFDASLLNDSKIPQLGKIAAHADTVIQLRKRTEIGFVADATTEHVKLTVSGLTEVDNIFSGSGENVGTQGVRLQGRHDGTNVPVIINTASAYTP